MWWAATWKKGKNAARYMRVCPSRGLGFLKTSPFSKRILHSKTLKIELQIKQKNISLILVKIGST
jgi:hypothetical protein